MVLDHGENGGTVTERTEIIIRLPNLSASQAAAVERAMAETVRKLHGSMSAVVREHGDGYALHKSRRKIV